METSRTWGGVKYSSNSAWVWASVSGADVVDATRRGGSAACRHQDRRGEGASLTCRCARASASKPESISAIVLRPHVQVSFQERSVRDGDVVNLVSEVLEDRPASGEVPCGAEADLGNVPGYRRRARETRSAHAHG